MGAPDRPWKLELGATPADSNAVSFKVWAPLRDAVAVRLSSARGTNDIPLARDAMGYFTGVVEGARPGDRYLYVLDHGECCPDPASRFQPEGVFGPSEVVDPGAFHWNDAGWRGRAMRDLVIYELHVGACTAAGTFASLVSRLYYLADLGITAVEIMPVAQFPGTRNWGYDGVCPFAPQNTYGGPIGLKEFVNAAHGKGLAVVLDVVYNHLGPEGNHLGRFAPYFSDRYRTPWGEAVNFDGPQSDGVRRFFIDNACYWVEEFHIDGLRLDAIHGIFDFGARHFLKEVCAAVHLQAKLLRREVFVIAESDLNDPRVIDPPECGGYGFDAQWNDDFHHALHALLTGERTGYYQDFGKVADLEKAFREGFVYTGQYSPHRGRRHGGSAAHRPAHQFVVFSQNHDQVGNRVAGDRLSVNQSFANLKLAAGLVLLSPFIPLLFMGEEYGEIAPFCYFTNYTDLALGEAVRLGRKQDSVSPGSRGWARDPQAESTFVASKLTPTLAQAGLHKILLEFYRTLLRLRIEIPALRNPDKENIRVAGCEGDMTFSFSRCFDGDEVVALYNFGNAGAEVGLMIPAGIWHKVIDSGAARWGGNFEGAPARIAHAGPGAALHLAAHAFAVYRCGEQEA